MRLRLVSVWSAPAPAAYTWFLAGRSRKGKRLARPTLFNPHPTHPAPQPNPLLGANRRFWQPRLAPQSTRRLALCTAGLFAGIAWWVAASACNPALFLTQSLAHLVNALAANPALACLALVSLVLRRYLVATWATIFVFYRELGSALAAGGRPAAYPTPKAAPFPPYLARPGADAYHLVLARSVYRLSRGLAVLDPCPAPKLPLPVMSSEPFAAFPASRLSWARLNQLTGSRAASSWASFTTQSASRAVLAKLTVAGSLRQAECLRSTAALSWNAAYPLQLQLHVAGGSFLAVRCTTASPALSAPIAGLGTPLRQGLLVSSALLMPDAGTASSAGLVQPSLFWAPLKAVQVSWS